MRSPLLRLAAGLLILAACDGKKKYTTEAAVPLELRSAPSAPTTAPSPVTALQRVG